ncbi:Bug family tripartite tricarboxylate transporter substrate binding protein [Comamonas sp. NoAH]|uniref:Bug family tripartite tricarboxylate transporter substrate binding protein n=1 Tax=Comamonas halotolerans TaxID=3041496 RepID=UPI0024E148B2|nr:tripartite tricarboxylate transporter substrate binding protein [Comamonas sp. NoAH]
MQRRKLLTMVASAVLASSPAAWAHGDGVITLVVPFAPGASVDTLARLVAREASRQSGSTVVVDNRPGANGIIGAEYVKHASAGGKQLFIANVGSHAINVPLYGERLPYDAIKDFAPVTLLWRFPSVLAVPAKSPANDVASLVAQGKKNGITFASAGSGSGGHLLGEMLKQASGATQMLHVPYKGAAPAVIDLMAGRVDCFFVSYSSIQRQVEQGLLRVLAVASDQRLDVLPQVPTLAEAGYGDVLLDNWFGLVASSAMPDSEVQRLHKLFAQVLSKPELVQQMADQGVQAMAMTPVQFTNLMRSDIERLGRVVARVGARAD